MQRRAISDKWLTPGAAMLILRLLEQCHLQSPFTLTHKDAARLCGLRDKATIYARINQLVPNYLERQELTGCPPRSKFKLNIKP